ncbi:hypothetical protein LBMAG53_23980 [Planctomycetota bacterium]|nr:hypothetical protein LBMAG53_23980 [Planctomycetota bacterium]
MAELALHGWRIPLPVEVEPVGIYGHWRNGHALLARGRQAVLAISWERTAITPDPQRTLNKITATIRRQERVGRAEIAADQRSASWTGPSGTWHAVFRQLPESGLVLVARQLVPATPDDLRRMLAEAEGFAAATRWPWDVHGIAIELPAWWRLAGLHQVAGLARAVWFLQPPAKITADREGMRTTAVLVARRYALASRILAGRSPVDWLRVSLRAQEHVTTEETSSGVTLATVDGPGSTWWRRWRGRRETTRYRLTVDAAADRLLVLEFRGGGDPPWDANPG